MTETIFNKVSRSFTEAFDLLESDYQGSSLTDVFVVIDKSSGELFIYDDEEHLLSQTIIDEWVGTEDDIEPAMQIRSVIQKFDDNNYFDNLDIYKPFSISITDDNFVVQDELLVIEDESLIRLENDFMEKMDKEFDEFLDKLLKD